MTWQHWLSDIKEIVKLIWGSAKKEIHTQIQKSASFPSQEDILPTNTKTNRNTNTKKAEIQNGQEWHSSSILPSSPSSCLRRGPPTETLNGAGERRTDGSTVDLNKYKLTEIQKYNMSFRINCSTLYLNNSKLSKIQDLSISDQYYNCRIYVRRPGDRLGKSLHHRSSGLPPPSPPSSPPLSLLFLSFQISAGLIQTLGFIDKVRL